MMRNYKASGIGPRRAGPGQDYPPLRDRIRPGVRVLFVGINPGVRSSVTGHHFAGFSNRFWKLLYDSGLVPERIGFEDDVRLPEWGFGITNIVARPTPGIDALRPDEYADRPRPPAAEGATLRAGDRCHGGRDRVPRDVPRTQGHVSLGLQPERLGESAVFVLPNPSGRNAHFSYGEMLAAFSTRYQKVRQATDTGIGASRTQPLESSSLNHKVLCHPPRAGLGCARCPASIQTLQSR